MNDKYNLISNLDSLHTTELGEERIRRNLTFNVGDVVLWCKEQIINSNSSIIRKGKNWYIENSDFIITVNASSNTIITVHRLKK